MFGMAGPAMPWYGALPQNGQPGQGLMGFLGSPQAFQMGMGLLSGRNNQEAFSNAMKGFQAGSDEARLMEDRAREKQQRDAFQKAVSGLKGYSPEDRALLASDQGLARSVLASSMAKKYAGDKESLTELQKNYRYAVQSGGFKGSFVDFMDAMKGSSRAPQVESFYDEKTGSEYKATYNPQSKQWDRIGGEKRTQPSLAPVDKKELYETDESIASGMGVLSSLSRAMEVNKKAFSGFGADQAAWLARNDPFGLMDKERGAATTELDNIVKGQALEQLKTVFGGMPTEGERKVLIEIQGSSDRSPKEREMIYRNAYNMAARRIKENQMKAQAIRKGQYFSPDYQAGSGGQVDSGGQTLEYDPATGQFR